MNKIMSPFLRRFLLVGLVLITLVLGLYGCLSDKNEEDQGNGTKIEQSVALLIPTEEKEIFAADIVLAEKGLQTALSDFSDTYLLSGTVSEPLEGESYFQAAARLAADGTDLILLIGVTSERKMKALADEHPETGFAVIEGTSENLENVMCLQYREEEAAFLSGVIAALSTKTGSIGLIGSVEGQSYKQLKYGFRAGVNAVAPEMMVLEEKTGFTSGISDGRNHALSLVAKGADIIFDATGNAGEGIEQIARQFGVKMIDSGAGTALKRKDAVLCSLFKRVDDGVYYAIQSLIANKFKGGIYSFGVDYEAVGYEDPSQKLTKEITRTVSDYAAGIASGAIIVPFDSFGVK